MTHISGWDTIRRIPNLAESTVNTAGGPFMNVIIISDLTLMLPTPRKCVTVFSVWKLAPELGCRSKSDSIFCTSAPVNLQIIHVCFVKNHQTCTVWGGNLYRAGLSIGRKVLKVMFWEVPPAVGPLL